MGPRPYSRVAAVAAIGVAVVALPVIAAVVGERHHFEVPDEGEARLEVRLDVALGSVLIGVADQGMLFQGDVQIETDHVKPSYRYHRDGNTGRLEVELETQKDNRSFNLSNLSAARSSQWNLRFSDRVPLDLDVELGAAKGDLDFTGLSIERLKVDLGATRATIRFDEPNPVVMEEFSVNAGASQVELLGLGNARSRRFRFGGGVGSYTLDFTGSRFSTDSRAYVEVGMAALTMLLPEGEPVVINAPDNWLCTVEVPGGFVKKGKGVWFSEQVTDADRAFRVVVEAGVGKITFAYP